MLRFVVRITNVDINGFWGREHHPQPSDIGRIAIIHEVKQENGSCEEFDQNNGDQDHDSFYTVLHGNFEDTGEPITLIGDEVEFERPYTT